jgi:serine/threonine protein kinase
MPNLSISDVKKFTIYIQMELCKETLNDFLDGRRKNNLLDEDLLFKTEMMVSYLRIFLSVAQSVAYVHESNLIHRDLKPANIFIGHNAEIKLGDFGLATEVTDKKYVGLVKTTDCSSEISTCLSYHTKNVGTAMYAANEQLNDNYYDQKVTSNRLTYSVMYSL